MLRQETAIENMIKSEMSKQAFRKDEIIASEANLGE